MPWGGSLLLVARKEKKMIKFFYRLLEIPMVYRVVGFILGPGGPYLRKKINKKVFRNPSHKALDVGCGPAPTTPEPLELLVGLYVNESYIKEYTGGYIDTDPNLVLTSPPGRRRLGYVASATQMPFLDGCFDEVRSALFFTIYRMKKQKKPSKKWFGAFILADIHYVRRGLA